MRSRDGWTRPRTRLEVPVPTLELDRLRQRHRRGGWRPAAVIHLWLVKGMRSAAAGEEIEIVHPGEPLTDVSIPLSERRLRRLERSAAARGVPVRTWCYCLLRRRLRRL